MKKYASNIILILAFLVGLSLLLYPTVSDYWNYLHQTRAVFDYTEQVAEIDNEVYKQMLEDARKYNGRIQDKENPYIMSEEDLEEYQALLNPTGNGVMGYIDIPVMDLSMPIYHGVEESVLQVAIGHIEWTSLPVGGEGTHSVVSGHRGLPSAKLFTELDKLVVGDLFMLHVLDETFTYEVDQILIVEPHEVKALNIVEGKDYCTLVTCTPYGINSHRLLVRGHRVENLKEAVAVRVTADAIQLEPVIVAPIVAAPMLLVLLLWLLIPAKKRR